MRLRAALTTTGLGVALALLAASPSYATLTLGPDLTSLTPAPSGYSCNDDHDCTLVNASVGAGFGSPLLVSPVNGSITRIRVRTGPGGSGFISFRMLRPAGNGAYTGEITFGVVNPPLPPNSIIEFPGFPISAGEAIGVDCCRGGSDNITTATVPGSGNFLVWGTGTNPLLENRETRAPDSNQTDQLLMLNAEIEPYNMFGVTKEKLKGSKVVATVTPLNSGVVTATGKWFRRTSVNVDVPTGASGRPAPTAAVRMVVKAKKKRRARVRRASKAKLTISYTPNFGTTSTAKVLAERKPPTR